MLLRHRSALTYSVICLLLPAPAVFATTYDCAPVPSPGSYSPIASGLNNSGTMVGTYTNNAIQHGFVENAEGGNFTAVSYPGPPGSVNTQLFTVNNNGIAVGSYLNPQTSASGYFTYDTSSGAFTPITVPSPYSLAAAYGINDNGNISVLVSEAGATYSFGILNPDGTLTLVPGYSNASGGQAQNQPGSINNSAQMLESDHTAGQTALVTSAGASTSISGYAWGLNNPGSIVGYALDPILRQPPYVGFVRDPSGNYSDAICPGVPLFATPTSSGEPLLLAINDGGLLVGGMIATPEDGLAQISFSSTSLSFPSTAVGQTSAPQTVTITNTGNVRLDIAAPTGIFFGNSQISSFEATGCLNESTLTASIDAGESCTISVTASPTGEGQQTASLEFHDSAPGSPHAIALSVTGTQPTSALSQTITFNTLSNQPLGTAPFQIAASASSGLAVSFSSTTTSVCTVSGNTVTLVAPGSCSITASQAGNSQYEAALAVTQTFGVVQPASSGPTINTSGIVPIYGSAPTIEAGEWISIYGTNLAPAAMTWNGNFPETLSGTSVTIDNKPGYIWFVSPTQINVQAPDDTNLGSVPVVVTTQNGSVSSMVNLATRAPSFSLLDPQHVAGIILRPDGSGAYGSGTYDIVGPTGSSLGYKTVAAKAGDTVELFGVGFGPTNPVAVAGQPFTGAAPTTSNVQIQIGSTVVIPSFAGLAAAGEYQINITIPSGLGAGDTPLVATVGGSQTQTGVVISLQ